MKRLFINIWVLTVELPLYVLVLALCICNWIAIKLHIDGIKTYTNSKRTVAEYKLVYKPVQSDEYDILCADVEIQETFLEQHLFPTKEELLKSL